MMINSGYNTDMHYCSVIISYVVGVVFFLSLFIISVILLYIASHIIIF